MVIIQTLALERHRKVIINSQSLTEVVEKIKQGLLSRNAHHNIVKTFNGSQLAKMKNYTLNMSLS